MSKQFPHPIQYAFSSACLLGLLLVTHPVAAANYNLSGFGSIGYAQSNQSFNYQRNINHSGTFLRDTVLGAQMDVALNQQWGATVQAKLAAAPDSDNGWQATPSWAFVSYRPNNDLLLRMGKLRVPLYLNSENLDVGTTFPYARLPIEVYSVSPTNDFIGASISKEWDIHNEDVSLNGFWGKADAVPWRIYQRDAALAIWQKVDINTKGLSVDLRQEDRLLRIGYNWAEGASSNGELIPVTAVASPAPLPGMTGSYFNKSGGVPKIHVYVTNVGVDVGLSHDFRATGEYIRRNVTDTDMSVNTESYYVSLLKKIDRWTPYVTYAQIKSKNLDLYQAINSARVQGGPPGVADSINAGQRLLADYMVVYDQNTWSVGTSYSLSLKSKIKAEWSAVQTGATSAFVDAPVGGESGNRRINVYSLSYNFTF